MPKKILPINKNPSITSYVQHSYTNAIADNNRIATVYIDNISNFELGNEEPDLYYEINQDLNTLELKDKRQRRSNSFHVRRKCKEIDEVIVKLNEVKLLDSLTYVRLSIGTDEEFAQDKDFFFRWNQYDITLRDSQISYPSHFYLYYKFTKTNNVVQVSVSKNKEDWKMIYTENMNLTQQQDVNIYIQIYYGKNQYEEWKYMNYIQLFYDESDVNTVYLDYFMFPRKGFDASYQYLCHFLDTEYINVTKCFDYYENVHHYIKDSIEQDYYVNISLDEYYVSGRFAYKKVSYHHFNLFYGYNDDLQEYYILGYNDKGKLAISAIPYHILQSEMYGENIVRYKYSVNNCEIKFDINYVKQAIREYVYGIDSSLKFSNVLANREGCYGLNIFDKLRLTERGRDLIIYDKRISFVLYEHCKLMKERLLFLNDRGFIPEDRKNELNLKCQRMLHDAEILKNTVIKNQFVNCMNEKIITLLDSLYHSEKEFYLLLLQSITV